MEEQLNSEQERIKKILEDAELRGYSTPCAQNCPNRDMYPILHVPHTHFILMDGVKKTYGTNFR